VFTKGEQLVVGEVFHSSVGINSGICKRLLGPGTTHTINVGESDLNPLITGNINSGKTCHGFSPAELEGL
jgi:hypothetical protein